MKKYLKQDFNWEEYVTVADELPLWSAPFGLKLLESIDYKPNISALDIGFGTGFPLTELALRLGESCTIYGIDPWKEAIIRAKKKIAFYQITNIRMIEGYAESIPLNDNSIDLVVSNNGLNNVTDMDKVTSECSRILKTGGQFVQTMNMDKSMIEFYEQLEQVLSELKLEKEIELMHQHIYQKRKPLDEVVTIVEKNGFIIRNLEQQQFSYKFSNGSAMLNHYFIRLAFMDAWIKIIPQDLTEQIFDTIESRLNEKSVTEGGIKLSIPFVIIDSWKK